MGCELIPGVAFSFGRGCEESKLSEGLIIQMQPTPRYSFLLPVEVVLLIKSEEHGDSLCARTEPGAATLIGWCFKEKKYKKKNDPGQILKATWEFLKAKMANQLPNVNPIINLFPISKQEQLKTAVLKTWQSITIEETHCLVMFISSRHQAVVAYKGFF